MSLQRNLSASFASQAYVTLIGILMVPLYIEFMGAEAFGLVGFFALLQAWFNLLDVGLTPTVARETARHRGGATDALAFRRLVRALEAVFLVLALAGGAALLAGSASIADDWLQASQLPRGEVLASIRLMALAIALRWMSALYRSAISGCERLVWLGGFNAAIATLRFMGVIPWLMFVGTSPILFFGYQLAVAGVELLVLLVFAYRLFPAIAAGDRLPWTWAPLKPVLRFSLSMAFASSAWVFVTQTDKLVLSRILPLADFGYFTMAVLVASGILILSGPVGSALMPRLATLEAEGKHAQMILVYRHATQLVAVVAGAASMTVAFNAEALLWAWTGNPGLAARAASVLALYALGNGILAIAAFPFYLQFAKGDLRLHLVGNALFVVLLVPLIIWAAMAHGGVGAGYVWLGVNLLLFVAWLPLVHRRFAPGLNLRWYSNDIAVIVAAIASSAYFASLAMPAGGSRTYAIAHIVLSTCVAFTAGAAASSTARTRLRTYWRGPALRRS